MHINSKNIHKNWIEYTLTNDKGISISLLDFGGIITKIMTPNQNGTFENIVLGYQHYENYEQNPHFFGAIIGRVAGRIKNATFTIDGNTYYVNSHEGKHHLHGGDSGFHKVIWDAKPFQHKDNVGVLLSHVSPDGEAGYPGKVRVSVTYTLTNSNELIIDYEALSNKKTPLTLTNHTYFNLTGNSKSTVENHFITLDSNQFIELDSELIPTGNILDVAKTPFDFRVGGKILAGFTSTHPQNILASNGYDHYFIFNDNKGTKVKIYEETSGRILSVKTNQPGVVFYTGNGLDNQTLLQEKRSAKHLGFCLETQAPPASLECKGLPSIILDKDKRYKKQAKFSFDTL